MTSYALPKSYAPSISNAFLKGTQHAPSQVQKELLMPFAVAR